MCDVVKSDKLMAGPLLTGKWQSLFSVRWWQPAGWSVCIVASVNGLATETADEHVLASTRGVVVVAARLVCRTTALIKLGGFGPLAVEQTINAIPVQRITDQRCVAI